MSGTDQTEAFFNRVEHPLTAETDTAPSEHTPTAIATPVTFCGELATADGLADLTGAELSPEVLQRVDETYGK